MNAEQLIDYLEGAQLVKLLPLKDSYFIIEALRGGQRLQVTAKAVEILSPEALPTPAKPAKKPKRQLKGGRSVFAERQHWPIEVLQREGLPLYWNQQWLVEEIERHGSVEAAAKANGYPPQSVNNFAVRVFGMQRRPRLDHHHRLQAKDLRAQGLSQREIAKRLGISLASVSRALRA